MMNSLIALDTNILLFIQDHLRFPFLTPFMKGLSYIGEAGIVWIVLTLILLICKRTRRVGICSAIALILMVVLNDLALKHLVNRARPYEVIDGLKLLMPKADSSSFPSGHASSSFSSAVAIALNTPRKYGVAVIILAALISFSRLYVGIHYPSDVLVGVLTGILYGYLGTWLGRKLYGKLPASWRSPIG